MATFERGETVHPHQPRLPLFNEYFVRFVPNFASSLNVSSNLIAGENSFPPAGIKN